MTTKTATEKKVVRTEEQWKDALAPEQYRAEIAQAERLGRLIYKYDRAAWVATDASNIGWYETYMFSVVNVLCTDSGKTLTVVDQETALVSETSVADCTATEAEHDTLIASIRTGVAQTGTARSARIANTSSCSGGCSRPVSVI